MQNNSKQLNAWYEVEVEEGGTKMFVFNYFLLCTRGRAAAAGNTQSSHWKCTEQHSRMINTHLQRSHHENAKYTQTIGNAQNNNLGCSTSSSQICKDAHNTTQLSQIINIFICKDLSEILSPHHMNESVLAHWKIQKYSVALLLDALQNIQKDL